LIETGLSGKRALVAGGASGIGRSIVLALEAEGARVAVVDASSSDVGTVRLQVRLGEPDASEGAVTQAAEALDGLDLVVYTAAVARHEPVLRVSQPAWRETIESNVAGCVWTCRAAGNLMVANGGGAILVIGSTTLYTPAAGEAVYRASKAALKAFVEVLAIELAPFSIRVNLLTPGAVDTPLTAGMTAPQREVLTREIPLGRQASPAELNATALLLLSDRLSPYTTGAEFVVDGGIRLRPMPRTSSEE
jgi:NAD(P)-dependent dehydrogenase (short-subunit alcohol dehydrogenase family)